MLTLTVDSSTKEIGLGIFDGQKVLAEQYVVAEARYNKILVPLIDEILKKIDLNIEDIDVFASTLGPGSFTGIRVGMASMKAFAQGLNKKFFGITILEIMANSVQKENTVIYPIIDAKRNEIYAAAYVNKNNKLNLKTDIKLMSKEKFFNNIQNEDTICYLKYENIQVDLFEKNSKISFIELEHVDMKSFNEIILKEKENLEKANNVMFTPAYIMKPDAKTNFKERKLYAKSRLDF